MSRCVAVGHRTRKGFDYTNAVLRTRDGGSTWELSGVPLIVSVGNLTEVSCASVSVCAVVPRTRSVNWPTTVFTTAEGRDWKPLPRWVHLTDLTVSSTRMLLAVGYSR